MKIHNIQLNKIFSDGYIPCSLTDLMEKQTKRDITRENIKQARRLTTVPEQLYAVYYRKFNSGAFFTTTEDEQTAKDYCESLRKTPFVTSAHYTVETR